MNLLETLRKSRHAPAVPEVRRTRPVSKWTGFKPIAANLPAIKPPSPALSSQNTLPAPARRSKLTREERAKMGFLLEAYNRKTREVGESGRRNQGALKASGVEIGKQLLFGYYNVDTGQLDPSDATISRDTGWSVRTVARARERLRLSGLLSWVRRSKWSSDGWRPHSNLYSIGQRCGQTTVRNTKNWGGRIAASPPALVREIAGSVGVVL